MSLRDVANVVGLLQVFVALAMFATAGISAIYQDGDTVAFLVAGAITFVIGASTLK